MVFKGTKKYSTRKIKESIEGVGGSLNGFTSEEFTCYLTKIPGAHLEEALDVLCDMARAPSLKEDELRKERTVILEEINMYKDHPQSYVHELLDELLWTGHPLGLPVIGSQESLLNMGRSDIRNFKESRYTASNMVICACGNLDHKKIIHKIKGIFTTKSTSDRNNFVSFSDKGTRPKINIFKKDTEQAHIAIGFKSYRRDHPLRHALSLLNIVLGANMSSRLFDELREKRGLAYEIGTNVRRFADTGAFVVHVGTDNKKAIDSISVIIKELSKISKHLVTKDEFRRAKEFYTGQISLGLEDTMDHMLWLGESVCALDRIYTKEKILKEIKKVRIEDLKLVAGEIFTRNNFNLALIGRIDKNRQGSILNLSNNLN